MPDQSDIICIVETLCRAGYPVATRQEGGFSLPLLLRYRNNPDGTIRWVWYAGTRIPVFLRFYHAGTRRARLLAGMIRRLFAIRAGRLFASGTLTLYASPDTFRELEKDLGQDFALFTGTPGPNRKSLLWYAHQGAGTFRKIALTPTAATIIRREEQILSQLQTMTFRYLRPPGLTGSGTHWIAVEDLGEDTGDGEPIFADLPAKALGELSAQTLHYLPVDSTPGWHRFRQQLAGLETADDPRMPPGMIRKLRRLADSIPSGQPIPCTLAHGDFTPWNMARTGDRLGVYDWELFLEDAPAGYDAIHYTFQSAILQHRHPISVILQQIRELDFPDSLDRSLHLRLYLLMNTCYYLDLYHRQPHWHRQVHWLLHTWNEALNAVLAEQGSLSCRQLFIMDLFDHIRDWPYVALKWTETYPEDLPPASDIDLFIQQAYRNEPDAFLRHHAFTAICRMHRKSFMKNYTIFLRDGSLLSIDLLWHCMRKDIRMLDDHLLLEGAQTGAGQLRIPFITGDFSYTWLFYLLNGAPMPEHYRSRFLSASPAEQETLSDYFHRQWYTGCTDWQDALHYDPKVQQRVLARLRRRPDNQGAAHLLNRLHYYLDLAGEWWRRRGIVITFSGVDGAGKSTVIAETSRYLEKYLRRRVVVLRHRPSLLPILSAWKHGKSEAERKSVATLPRQGSNDRYWSSLLRFAYYYTDYWFGQFYIQLRYVRRGYIVLYDRYYFDFINDSRRSNIRLSPVFTGWFYRFLLKPDLNFFLYADPELILSRKQELDATTIRELTDRYLRLFEQLAKRYRKSKYLPIYNQYLDKTMDVINKLIKERA